MLSDGVPMFMTYDGKEFKYDNYRALGQDKPRTKAKVYRSVRKFCQNVIPLD
jgi:hypothetical protein